MSPWFPSQEKSEVVRLENRCGKETPETWDKCGDLIRVASEISRNEISRNVSRNFYFAFREIFEWLSRNFAKQNIWKFREISRNKIYENFAKYRENDLTKQILKALAIESINEEAEIYLVNWLVNLSIYTQPTWKQKRILSPFYSFILIESEFKFNTS